jgi:protein-S-isoprenylcysteine O-methyltransferase Ste14
MTDDELFRLMILLVVSFFLPIGGYHRIRSRTDEKLDRWQEGAVILFGLRLSGLPWFIGGIVWMIDSPRMAWSAMPIPVWVRWVGVALSACSGTLMAWTFHNLGRNLTDTVVTRRDHTFVATGPYRYVRHPFYLAIALGGLGGGLAMANWFVLLGIGFPLGFLVARTRIEEAKLVERFGGEYEDYMRRVGRFWPRIKRSRGDDKP